MNNRKRDLWLKYWEKRNNSIYDYKKEIDLINAELLRIKGKKVLSLGCGSGPHLRKLVKMGYLGTGIDINKNVIEIARDLSKKAYTEIKYIVGDIRNISIKEEHDLADAMHLSFSRRDWEKILKRIKTMIRTNGIFVGGFIYWDDRHEKIENGIQSEVISNSDGTEVIEIIKYDVNKSHYNCNMYLLENENGELNVDYREINIYYFDNEKCITDMLKRKRFGNIKIHYREAIGIPGLKASIISCKNI